MFSTWVPSPAIISRFERLYTRNILGAQAGVAAINDAIELE
jgi:hypothetical protein